MFRFCKHQSETLASFWILIINSSFLDFFFLILMKNILWFDCVYYRETLFWVNIQDKKRRIENSMPYNYTLNVSLDKITSFFSFCNIGAEQATVNWGHQRGRFILMIISTCLGNPLNSTPLLTFTSKISPMIHLQVLNQVMR